MRRTMKTRSAVTCPRCGKSATHGMGTHRRYCDANGIAERFWAKVKKGPGCWIWQAALNTKGYGTLMILHRQHIAHRVAWVLSGRELPTNGKFLCHTCDEPKCVNPSHMFIGDHKDNAVDKARKGRCRNSTLTIEQVRQVKRELASKRKNTEIAAMFGVSPAVISGIKTGRNFWHVEADQRK